jgi:acyl carrier protein
MDDAGLDTSDPRVGEILQIVAKETEVDVARLRPDATIEELGIPSLDMAQTVFALESHFDVEIPVVSERSGAEFITVADLVTHVLAAVDKARGKPAGAAA